MRLPDAIIKPTPTVRRIVLVVIVLAQAVASTVVSLRVRGRDIDDIWNVELWSAWRPFSNPILLPRDTFVLHAPVNIIARAIFGDGTVSLIAATMVLNAIGAVLVLRFVQFIGRRAALPPGTTFALQVAIGLLYSFISLQVLHHLGRPNYRNIEIGLFLLAIELIVRAAERPTRRWYVAGVCLALGVIAFNDPMFLICGLASWLAVAGVRWVLSRDTPVERRAAVVAFGGIAAFVVVSGVFRLAGVHISDYAAPQFANFLEFPRAATQTVELLLINFGASFSNLSPERPATWLQLFRLGLLIMVVFGAWKYRSGLPAAARLPLAAVVVPIGSLMLASTFSTIGSFEGQSSRYLVPADLLLIVLALIPLVYGTQRYRTVLAVSMMVVVVFVGLDVVRFSRGLIAYGEETAEFDAFRNLADQLERDGATIGYGPMWVAVPTEYFADASIGIASVDCGLGDTPAIANFSNLGVLDDETQRSFYVVWDRDAQQCTREQIISRFGAPVNEERFEFDDGAWGHFDVLWYDGNVGADLPVRD